MQAKHLESVNAFSVTGLRAGAIPAGIAKRNAMRPNRFAITATAVDSTVQVMDPSLWATKDQAQAPDLTYHYNQKRRIYLGSPRHNPPTVLDMTIGAECRRHQQHKNRNTITTPRKAPTKPDARTAATSCIARHGRLERMKAHTFLTDSLPSTTPNHYHPWRTTIPVYLTSPGDIQHTHLTTQFQAK